jgi:hypothetical protein
MSVPEPNSPEARRAAQKVRNVFYFIAAANIVLIAIVMWPHPKPPPPAPANAAEPKEETSQIVVVPANPPVMQEMDAVNDRIIAAYRERDAERFTQEFSPQATPPVTEDYFRNVVIGLYHEEFGDITGKKLTGETNLDPDYGMLVYEITCGKKIRAKISTNFRRENGTLKAVQWRMERM